MLTFGELKKKSGDLYMIVVLEKYLKHSFRQALKKIFFVILVGLFILMLLGWLALEYAWSFENESVVQFFQFTINNIFAIRAWFFIATVCYLDIYLLEAFYYSIYFSDKNKVNFELARTVYTSDGDDLTKGFFESYLGKVILLRLGIDFKTFTDFLANRKKLVTDVDFEMKESNMAILTMSDYGLALFNLDGELQRFLISNGITEKDFIGTINWVRETEWRSVEQGRWWTRERLARIPSIGRNWSFGKVYLLEKYGRSIFDDKAYQNLGDKSRIYEKYTNELQQVLLKDQGANAMIIGSTADIAMNVVATLGKLLVNGKIHTALENRRIFIIDGNEILDSVKDKATFERTLKEVLIQANNAGNALVVIPQLPNFINSAHEIGVDVAELFSEFISSSNIQLIVLCDEHGYHQTIETNKTLMQHFEKISVKQIDQDGALEILKTEALKIESEYDILFTFGALQVIAESVTRYFSEGEYSDKILDLMEEITVKSLSENKKTITEKEVADVVALKTGIPQGAIGSAEKEKLNSLEEVLHKRVIGQNLAIESISKAIRRARSGIQNPKRPIGSFLFLGPTGVGKTETTKALAESFFGDENKIIRFDMSEYNSSDAIVKLIGGAGISQVGSLSSKIRENQYGVLLLDEFEKADTKVHDLFLQIIDEGIFTDARGEEINARNLIIIATSNAGSDLIYQATLNNSDLLAMRETIINEIIKRGIFRPEFINRFDGTILFHPLKDEHIIQVAKLMLQKLDKRLIEKGIRIDINEDLIQYLVEIGRNPQFGARAINRAIQDVVEAQIAEGIIAGTIANGKIVSFRRDPGSNNLQVIV